MPQATPDPQAEAVTFLLSPAAHPGAGAVTHVQTHGAHVFLCGDQALKIKRAVRYDYMDLSSLALREAMLQRELHLNKRTAPMIYRDVVPLTREADGQLALNGSGAPVEWVLRMHRFPAACELTAIAERGALGDTLAEALGTEIHAYHRTSPRRRQAGDRLIGDILDELGRVLPDLAEALGTPTIETFLRAARATLQTQAPRLRIRTTAGHVRRVHGDLHLRNIVLLDGHPVLFDALEFDETLGTCDVLYDLAFLLMDLCHRDLTRQANIVLTSYLLAARGTEDAGLAALPLFLAVRAAIRAMVAAQTDRATHSPGASSDEARRYLAQAIAALAPARPVVIAVGGVSGTGKTVLARDLAPRAGACPGAVHLRTDTERKSAATDIHYDPQARGQIYTQMFARAGTLLAAGRGVILDATFLDPRQRDAAEALARAQGVPFLGLWLTAPEQALLARVRARHGDASDADGAVVQGQLARHPTAPGWTTIDASHSPDATRAAAMAALGQLDLPAAGATPP